MLYEFQIVVEPQKKSDPIEKSALYFILSIPYWAIFPIKFSLFLNYIIFSF